MTNSIRLLLENGKFMENKKTVLFIFYQYKSTLATLHLGRRQKLMLFLNFRHICEIYLTVFIIYF